MRQAIGVDVTTHKETRDAAADTRRKPRLRARYYVELVVGSRHADHTRLGFSGTFKALLALHHAFAQAYMDRLGDAAGRASLDSARPRRSVSSSSSSTASQSSVSSASSSGMRGFFKHALGLRGAGRHIGSDHTSSARSSLDQLHHVSWSDGNVPSLPPFPAQHKLLVRLEGDGSKDDAKIEARAAALFEYYSQVFNSEDGELYVDLIHHHALHAAERKKQAQAEDSPEVGEAAPGLFKQLLSHHSKSGGSTASSNEVEFLEPVYVRKSRGHKSAKRSSASKGSSNQRAH
jgi:hypothetical protein